MRIYHGTIEVIANPDVKHSKRYLDFGKGFYLTTYENQAQKWALRKAMRKNTEAIVNIYELDENWDGLRVLSFEEENDKWLDFVNELRYYKMNNQICIINQETIDKLLTYVDYYEVKKND